MSAKIKELFTAAPWRALSDQDIGHTLSVPTMLQMEESKFYFWLGANIATNGGAMVDLGSFIGGSTARLAGGVIAGGTDARVHAYDRFTAGPAAKRKVLYPAGIPRFAGDDVLELSKELLSPFAPHVVHHPGDINTQVWEGPSIDLIIHDASKTRASADRQSQIFWPALKAGHSIVVQQDIIHPAHPWVAIQMELWHDHFEPLTFVRGSTIAYLCTKTPEPKDFADRQTATLSHLQEIDLLARARDRLAPFSRKVRPTLANAINRLAANPRVEAAWQMGKNDL